MIELRDYQEDCVAAHWRYLENSDGHPLFVVPTGGGKSHIIASFLERSIEAWPTTRAIVITHVKELIQQNFDKYLAHVGRHASAGIYSAGLGFRDTHDSVIFAGIQSMYQRARELGHFDLVLVDECHMIPKKGHGRYRSYIAALKEINPHVRVLGYTATHYRLDGGYLHKGKGRIFTDVAYDVKIERLVKEGWLSDIVAKRPRAGIIDTRGIATSNGDFKNNELELAAIRSDVDAAVAEAVDLGRDRKRWLVFACGIAHAEIVCEKLDKHGISNRLVTGKTKRDERREIIEGSKAGKFTALVNVGVLTTGFDSVIDLMVIMRPTQSTGLYVQIYGRGMRIDGSSGIWIGKKDCIALDYGGNVDRHGPINDVRPKRESSGPAPMKVCKQCQTYVMLGARKCPHCGAMFPEPAEATWKHEREASESQPLRLTPLKPVWLDVQDVFYRLHQKEIPSLRVEYMCGMRIISEWICLQHSGRALSRAHKWWLNRAGPGPIPKTIVEALERVDDLPKPKIILVAQDGEFERVAGVRWPSETEETDISTETDGEAESWRGFAALFRQAER